MFLRQKMKLYEIFNCSTVVIFCQNFANLYIFQQTKVVILSWPSLRFVLQKQTGNADITITYLTDIRTQRAGSS